MQAVANQPTRRPTKTKVPHWQPLLSNRSVGYTVGLAVLAPATLGVVVGFACPFWHLRKVSSAGPTLVEGLWLVCRQDTGTLSDCQETVSDAAAWLRGVQFLEVMGVVSLLVACVFAVVLNWARREVQSRLLEAFTGVGAIFAFTGSLAYVLQTMTPADSSSGQPQYSWSFGLNLAGAILAILSAILIATHNSPPRPESSLQGRNSTTTASAPKWLKSMMWPPKSKSPSGGREVSLRGQGRVQPLKDRPQDDVYGNREMWLLPRELYWVSNARA